MRNGEYELVKAPKDYPGKKYRGRYCYEHHLVWWKAHGKLPNERYVIHHKNGKHRDNTLENLELLSRDEHSSLHGKRKLRQIWVICEWCKVAFLLSARYYKYRLKTKKMKKLCCSRRCAAKYQFNVFQGG